MRQVIIRSGSKVRAVYCPDHGERRQFGRLARRLARLERRAARNAGTDAVAHGFVCGRSPVTCATAHIGAAVTVSCDLSGWYDSVTAAQVAAGLRTAGLSDAEATTLAHAACHTAADPSPRPAELAPRQGLPSSPAAANIAGIALDREILDGLAALDLPHRVVYTRYADDLTVSVWGDDSRETVDRILGAIRRAVVGMGWRLAERKTAIQRATAGRRNVVGVSVGPEDIAPPRSTRRRLRAATHAAPDSPQARGLAEWCRLRQPHGRDVWEDVAGILAADPEEYDTAVAVAADRLEDAGVTGRYLRGDECPEEQRRKVLTDCRRRLL